MPNEKIATAITVLCEAFSRKSSAALLTAYEIGLAGLSDALVERSVRLALQRCQFMPAPAELREIAITNGTSYANIGEAAFRLLQRAVARIGPDGSVNFQDGGINATVRRLGGWAKVCSQPRDEFDKWFRKDFIEAYTRVIRDGCGEEELRYLAGSIELKNAHLEGTPLRGGGTFDLARYGGRVVGVAARYKFLLAAPIPAPRISAAATLQIGVKLKTLEA